MAIRDRSGVQLVVSWIGLAFVSVAAFFVAAWAADMIGEGSYRWLEFGMWLVWIALAVGGIIVTVKWFGSASS
jgi:hypothetical protein